MTKISATVYACEAKWKVPMVDPNITFTFTWRARDNVLRTPPAYGEAVTYGITVPVDVYTLKVRVVDQVCNPLAGATVYFNGTAVTADAEGIATFKYTRCEVEVRAWYKGYEAEGWAILDQDKTVRIVVERMFTVTFKVIDKLGNPLDGEIILSDLPPKYVEATLSVPIRNGTGTIELWDGTYTATFRASPEINLGRVTVDNDKTVTFKVDVVAETVIETTEETVEIPYVPPPPPEVPVIPPELIIGPYVYILVGVLVFLGLLAIIVRWLRWRQLER